MSRTLLNLALIEKDSTEYWAVNRKTELIDLIKYGGLPYLDQKVLFKHKLIDIDDITDPSCIDICVMENDWVNYSILRAKFKTPFQYKYRSYLENVKENYILFVESVFDLDFVDKFIKSYPLEDFNSIDSKKLIVSVALAIVNKNLMIEYYDLLKFLFQRYYNILFYQSNFLDLWIPVVHKQTFMEYLDGKEKIADDIRLKYHVVSHNRVDLYAYINNDELDNLHFLLDKKN